MSDSNDLKVGDTVTLKSGGPKMTVESISVGEGVTCVWFQQHSAIELVEGPIPIFLDPQRLTVQRACLYKV